MSVDLKVMIKEYKLFILILHFIVTTFFVIEIGLKYNYIYNMYQTIEI